MWFGPGAATLVFVIGILLAVAPALTHDRTWARSLMALCGAALLLRYVARRLTATLDVKGVGMAGQLWVWTCLVAELLLIFDNFLSRLAISGPVFHRSTWLRWMTSWAISSLPCCSSS